MLFYEELEGFHMLFNREPIYDNKIRIISECLSYTLIISNPLLAVYLSNTYPNELFHHKDIVIDAILHYLNEFTELNGGARYKRIKHFEQYLFLIERMINFFNYPQGKYLLSILLKLSDVGIMQESNLRKEMSPNNSSKFMRFDNLENNFLIYSASPVKQCVLIMNI